MSDSGIPWTITHHGFFCPWDFPGKNIGVGCHFLLQGIFSTQGSNSHIRIGRQVLYHRSIRETQGKRIKRNYFNKTLRKSATERAADGVTPNGEVAGLDLFEE